MNKEILFAVGSTNPVKINAVAQAVAELWPNTKVIGVEIDSGVSHQPMSDPEMFHGALNRARFALADNSTADFGIGIEGGSLDSEDGMWAYAWVVVINRQGKIGKGQSGRFLLPEGVAKLVRDGVELGEADDKFFGRTDSKRQDGAIGILSNGRVTRLQLYKPAVTFALLGFIHPELY